MGFSATELTSLASCRVDNKFVDRFSGEILIAGTARCVWEDMNGVPEPNAVMTVNDMVMYWPGPVKFAYSHDEKQLIHWKEGRRRCHTNAYGPVGSLHTIEPCRVSGIHAWPFPGMGSSSLGACYVALAMGYDSVVLAGCPLDDTGHFYDPPRMKSNFTREAPTDIWQKAAQIFQGRVRSLSGRSREILS